MSNYNNNNNNNNKNRNNRNNHHNYHKDKNSTSTLNDNEFDLNPLDIIDSLNNKNKDEDLSSVNLKEVKFIDDLSFFDEDQKRIDHESSNNKSNSNNRNTRVIVIVHTPFSGLLHYSYDVLLPKNEKVVVSTPFGTFCGNVENSFYVTNKDDLSMPMDLFAAAYPPIIRVAEKYDLLCTKENAHDSKLAKKLVQDQADSLQLGMNVIDCFITLDGSKIVVAYTAETKVDFRKLLIDLKALLEMKIELRQITTRDRSKLVGGVGICGLPMCCSTFFTAFDGISLSLAKNQMLNLNSSKLSGTCGKYMCCLKYEDPIYTELKKKYPSLGDPLKVSNKIYTVKSLNVVADTILLTIDDEEFVEVSLKEFNYSKHNGKFPQSVSDKETVAVVSGRNNTKSNKEDKSTANKTNISSNSKINDSFYATMFEKALIKEESSASSKKTENLTPSPEVRNSFANSQNKNQNNRNNQNNQQNQQKDTNNNKKEQKFDRKPNNQGLKRPLREDGKKATPNSNRNNVIGNNIRNSNHNSNQNNNQNNNSTDQNTSDKRRKMDIRDTKRPFGYNEKNRNNKNNNNNNQNNQNNSSYSNSKPNTNRISTPKLSDNNSKKGFLGNINNNNGNDKK